jgi:hypothetical protein
MRRQVERDMFITARKMEAEARARYTLDLNFIQGLGFGTRLKMALQIVTRWGYSRRMEELRKLSNTRKLTTEEIEELRRIVES